MPAREITSPPRITKFTNCRILKNNHLIEQDLWIDSYSGKVLKDQEAFYELQLSPDQVVDLNGRILAPGFIDVQLNGAQGFDYSVPQATREEYDAGFIASNRGLIKTGVTSFLPTTVSTTAEIYQKVCCGLEYIYIYIYKINCSAYTGPTISRSQWKTSPRRRRRITGSTR